MTIKRKESGVGLVEVLAALFVLSVGLLGVAGLQAQGLRAGYSATQRSVAVTKAYEIIERMRANPNGVRDIANNSFYDIGMGGGAGTPLVICADLASTPAANCNAVELATHDIAMWQRSIDDAFPGLADDQADGSITVVQVGATANQPVNVVVTVQWLDRGTLRSYQTNTQIVNVSPS